MWMPPKPVLQNSTTPFAFCLLGFSRKIMTTSRNFQETKGILRNQEEISYQRDWLFNVQIFNLKVAKSVRELIRDH